MRIATYPHEGFYAFRSKSNPDELPLVVWLAEGLNIEDHYDEITEEEYKVIRQEIEKKRRQEMEAILHGRYNEQHNF